VASPAPVLLAVVLSTAGTLLFGVVLPATDVLRTEVINAANVDQPNRLPTGPAALAEP
jgi:hypothetical protein